MCFMSRAHRRCARVFREGYAGYEPGPWDRGDDWMRHHGRHHGSEEEGFGGFGVRRPLRFLAHKLELDEKQITELARILDELKTERAQAAVDDRRTQEHQSGKGTHQTAHSPLNGGGNEITGEAACGI